MPREDAWIACDIWEDPDFVRLSDTAQWMFLVVLTNEWLSDAGVVPLMVDEWATYAVNVSADDVRGFLDELERHGFIEVDTRGLELLVPPDILDRFTGTPPDDDGHQEDGRHGS
jgi:hypothetical protein